MARRERPPPGEFDASDENADVYAAFAISALRQPRFGELVRSWRESLGLTIAEAAAESDIGRGTWCDIEAGRDTLLSTAVRIMGWAAKNDLA